MSHFRARLRRRRGSQPNMTFDKTPRSTASTVNREINTQKYAAGTRPGGGGQGPALDQK